MIINGTDLLVAHPIRNMVHDKIKVHGRSYGTSEVGYDFRMKQRIRFYPPNAMAALYAMQDIIRNGENPERITRYERAFYGHTVVTEGENNEIELTYRLGRTALASSIEFFDIPNNLWCEFRNKSTNARHHIDAALGTDGEPGWYGHLTLELIFNGLEPVDLPAGVPILKAVFHEIKNKAAYTGKYQDQPDRPVSAILE